MGILRVPVFWKSMVVQLALLYDGHEPIQSRKYHVPREWKLRHRSDALLQRFCRRAALWIQPMAQHLERRHLLQRFPSRGWSAAILYLRDHFQRLSVLPRQRDARSRCVDHRRHERRGNVVHDRREGLLSVLSRKRKHVRDGTVPDVADVLGDRREPDRTEPVAVWRAPAVRWVFSFLQKKN